MLFLVEGCSADVEREERRDGSYCALEIYLANLMTVGSTPGPVCTTRQYVITSKVVSDFESKRSNFVCTGRKSGSLSK